MIRLPHISERRLYMIACREVTPGRLARYHLLSCPRCREVIRFVRDLDARLQTLDGPVPNEAMADGIRKRLREREAVILPATAPERRHAAPARAIASVAALLAIAAALSLLYPRASVIASSSAGELQFSSANLQSGATIGIRYLDAGRFGAESTIVLRVRWRTANSESYNFALRQATAATLTRGRRAAFEGSFVVPDSAVYASFAIENAAGTVVDSRNRELWAIMSLRKDGAPTYQALTQAYHDLIDGRQERALQALRERAELYPDLPKSGRELLFFERQMLGDDHADSTIPWHRTNVLRLHRLYSVRSWVPVEVSNPLRFYAGAVGDSAHPEFREISRYWTGRLADDSGGAGLEARIQRLFAATDSAFDYPARALRAYEAAWSRGDSIIPFLANNAFAIARTAGDFEAVLRWADRLADRNRREYSWGYIQLAEDPLYRDAGLDRLRRLLGWLDERNDDYRPLENTVSLQARADSGFRSLIFAAIGKALYEKGALSAALDTLQRATQLGWDASLFRRVGELLLQAGDTSAAAEAFLLTAVDPSTPVEVADSLRARTRMSAAEWRRGTAEASDEMSRRIMAGSVATRLPGIPRLATQDDRTVSLESLAAGAVTVVTFWSRHCGPSRLQFNELPRLSAELARHGIRLVAITAEKPGPEVARFVTEVDQGLPVYFDARREAATAFGTSRTPDYFILDREGVVRFEYTTLPRLLTQAVVLTLQDPSASPTGRVN